MHTNIESTLFFHSRDVNIHENCQYYLTSQLNVNINVKVIIIMIVLLIIVIIIINNYIYYNNDDNNNNSTLISAHLTFILCQNIYRLTMLDVIINNVKQHI